MIGRRGLAAGASALVLAAVAKAATAGATRSIPGAIRWDAWYGSAPGSSESAVNAAVDVDLAPARWRGRAPWFAAPVSATRTVIDGSTQACMDAEIDYAASAGLRYWAYCWYGQQSPPSPMQRAWVLHQASGIRERMNWCLLLQFSRIGPAARWNTAVPDYLGYFRQHNYQSVLNGRPLLYVFIDDPKALGTAWNGRWENVRTAFDALRTAAHGAGLASPYIVLMAGGPALVASLAALTGADAISSYSCVAASGDALPWEKADPAIRAYWQAMAATGTPIVPICQTGWDLRPRKQNPPPFYRSAPGADMLRFWVAPSPAQLTAHLQAAADLVAARPAACESKAIIIYSWDECDEGGNALIPSYTPSGPDTANISAAHFVRW